MLGRKIRHQKKTESSVKCLGSFKWVAMGCPAKTLEQRPGGSKTEPCSWLRERGRGYLKSQSPGWYSQAQ